MYLPHLDLLHLLDILLNLDWLEIEPEMESKVPDPISDRKLEKGISQVLISNNLLHLDPDMALKLVELELDPDMDRLMRLSIWIGIPLNGIRVYLSRSRSPL